MLDNRATRTSILMGCSLAFVLIGIASLLLGDDEATFVALFFSSIVHVGLLMALIAGE